MLLAFSREEFPEGGLGDLHYDLDHPLLEVNLLHSFILFSLVLMSLGIIHTTGIVGHGVQSLEERSMCFRRGIRVFKHTLQTIEMTQKRKE